MLFKGGKHVNQSVELRIDQQIIDTVDSVNSLGLVIDDGLTWEKHIQHIQQISK